MNTISETLQVINFLLSACDQKNQQIAALQAHVTELSKPAPAPIVVDEKA